MNQFPQVSFMPAEGLSRKMEKGYGIYGPAFDVRRVR